MKLRIFVSRRKSFSRGFMVLSYYAPMVYIDKNLFLDAGLMPDNGIGMQAVR
jgi:hypothetical protein